VPTPVLETLPAVLRRAERAREAERTARALGLVVVGALLPAAGALAGRSFVGLVAMPPVVGLAGGGLGGAVAAWRLVAAQLAALLDPARATGGAARRLAEEAVRLRALAAWAEDGPLVSAAIATAREAIAASPAHDDPEDWDALRAALAEAETAAARARSRLASPMAAGLGIAAAAAEPIRGASGREITPPEPAALSDEQRALLAALQERMPTRPPRPSVPTG
jgi:hypothetical protein